MNDAIEESAWKAYDKKDYATAVKLWEQLIESSTNETERDLYRHGYGYALVGLKRFDEAREIYRQLYEKTHSHIYIHQPGMVERESGEYALAASLFWKEQAMLKEEDYPAIAANLYEQGLIESLAGDRDLALELADRCLAVSLATEDKIMHGCAYRLPGDLWRRDCPEKARDYYRKSRKAFEDGGDIIACGEIDERYESIT